ncbi:hypothetical protein HP062_09760 [Pseudomonas sp. B14-6]|jgi:hypothetical protein|uniref:hypothetical protein n=1 Tax=Pseudomonas sp. B14-6 TaxID=2738843 RepID=UPI00155F365A|nr:hypothetical protein [Pseudomonas sp. B14-6]QKG65843.1 hypothetical protein HP062_09760 [Pseudomonas sp. B14-6]
MRIQADLADLADLKRLADAIHGKGTTVEMLNRWAQFEAACKPELIVALIAEKERYDEGMRAIACQLGAGGYNATELTADQLLAKVCDGLNAFTDTSGCLLDQVRSERDQLKSVVDSLSEAVRGAIKYVAFAFDQGMEGAEPAGLAMEDSVAMAGQL